MQAEHASSDEPARAPRVALVGLGPWGRNHLRNWHALGALRMVCEIDAARMDEALGGLEEASDIDRTTDFAQVLDRADVDGVVITTPAATHAHLARRALDAGKHVFVEKPLALTVSDGEDLVRRARVGGRVLMVGHVLMYHPAVRRLRALVAEGALGQVQYIYSNRLNLGRIRTEENSLWSFAPHDFALILALTGALPETVGCHGGDYLRRNVADVTLTSLTFPGGVRAHVFVSWLHPFKEQRFVVVGTRQMAVFDDTQPWGQKLVLYPHTVDWIDGQVPVANRAEARPEPIPQEEPLRAECVHFLECLRQGSRPESDGVRALRTLRVLAAAERSLQLAGQPVTALALPDPPAPPSRSGPVRHDAPTAASLGAPTAASPENHTGPAAPAERGYAVHPTATVDEDVVIGEGTRIWHYSHIMPGARIGARCNLGQNVYVGRNVRIGDRVKIQNNVSVYEGVTLEDEVFCGPSMVFTNVINPRAGIEKKDQFRPTRVRQGATLGANATIVCGTTIGRYALVGAGAVVTSDVPDHALVWGVPARQSGWVCACGETLRVTDNRATCKACGLAYELAEGALRLASGSTAPSGAPR